jgi:hypothetical protein
MKKTFATYVPNESTRKARALVKKHNLMVGFQEGFTAYTNLVLDRNQDYRLAPYSLRDAWAQVGQSLRAAILQYELSEDEYQKQPTQDSCEKRAETV